MNLSILFISKFGKKSASGYLGGLVYKSLFLKDGYIVKFSSISNETLDSLISSPPKYLSFLWGLGFRIVLKMLRKIFRHITEQYLVINSKSYDVIVLLKIDSKDFIKKIKNNNRKTLLYFGDSLWLENPKFYECFQLVDGVATDNKYTADYVKKYNSKCYIIPDYPQLEIFDSKRANCTIKRNEPLVIGWVGSPSTLYNLYLIWEPLERIFEKHSNIKLRLIGTGADLSIIPRFEKVRYTIKSEYSPEEMVDEVLNMEIGLFPLQNTERSRVRGFLKASVYMSGGATVIASPIGQAKDLIIDGFNGMLAKNSEEWEEKLELLITDELLRKKCAENGMNLVRNNFTREDCYRKLLEAINGTI